MLEVRILGNQPEPTLVNEGMNIIDFEVRTRDEEIFAVGKDMIEQFVALNPELNLTDGKHPNSEGIRVISKNLEKKLTNLLH